jgi:hypothetical protein
VSEPKNWRIRKGLIGSDQTGNPEFEAHRERVRAKNPDTPIAMAQTQKGISDRRMYPALSKNLRMESGETWMGRHGKNSLAEEMGNSNVTPRPPSVMASSNGCVMAQPPHIAAIRAITRQGCRRATIAARIAEAKSRKNGEWKKPR